MMIMMMTKNRGTIFENIHIRLIITESFIEFIRNIIVPKARRILQFSLIYLLTD